MSEYPFPNHPTSEEEAERVEQLMKDEQITKEMGQYERNAKTN
jgi:hypothetical protein